MLWLQDMTRVGLTVTEFNGCVDILEGAGSALGFELPEDVPSLTLALFQMQKNFCEISEILELTLLEYLILVFLTYSSRIFLTGIIQHII